MASNLENLVAAKASLIERIAAYEAEAVLATNYGLDGESYSHQSALDAAYERLNKIEALLARAEGPFEVRSYGG